jgi:hypothetical protein
MQSYAPQGYPGQQPGYPPQGYPGQPGYPPQVFRTAEARRGARAHKRPAARAGIPDACALLLMCLSVSAVVDVRKQGNPGQQPGYAPQVI